VSAFEELKMAIRYGGTKTVQLATGTYPANENLYIPANSNITILPPVSGMATIKVDAGYRYTFIVLGENATLVLGKEGAASDRLVIENH
jgi:hypothetical protein